MAKLDKPIIHFQIPHDEKGEPTVEASDVNLFMECVANYMGDKCYYIASPYDIDVIGAEVEKVKVDEITLKEFLQKYDFKGGAPE